MQRLIKNQNELSNPKDTVSRHEDDNRVSYFMTPVLYIVHELELK